MHAELAAAPGGATGAAAAHVTRAQLAALTALADRIKAPDEQIAEQLAPHADTHVVTSLSRSDTMRVARLLTEPGGCGPGP